MPSDTFISYSRKESDFAKKLVNGLEDSNISSWIDWRDIPRGTNWLPEILDAIGQSDVFLFVVSSDSLLSEICNREIAHARNLNKKILPLIRYDIDERRIAGEWYNTEWETIARENWSHIKELNWTFFRDQDDFATSLQQLVDAIKTDLGHVRYHTKLTQKALDWEKGGKKPEYLLMGDELNVAEGWLRISQESEPSPTQLHRTYITASIHERSNRARIEQEQQRRELELQRRAKRRLQYALIVLVLSLLTVTPLTVVAFTERSRAREEATRAETARDAAEASLFESRWAQARFSSILSQARLEAGFPQEALSLALASLDNTFGHYGVYPVESAQALIEALAYPLTQNVNLAFGAPLNLAAWSPDGNSILLLTADGRLSIWSASSGAERVLFQLDPSEWGPPGEDRLYFPDRLTMGAIWSKTGERVLSWTVDGTVTIWDASTGSKLLAITPDEANREASRFPDSVQYSSDERFLLVVSFKSYVVDLQGNLPNLSILPDSIISGASWSSEGNRVNAWVHDGTLITIDVETRETVFRSDLGTTLSEVYWNADDTQVLAWNTDGTVMVVDTTSGEILLEIDHEDKWVMGAEWSPDQTKLITWTSDGTVQLVDVRTGDVQVKRYDERAHIKVAWRPDSKFVVVWSSDSKVAIWDAETGNEILSLDHTGSPNGISWSHSGDRILTWSDDVRLNVWDFANGDRIASLAHEAAVAGVQWGRDEKSILSWDRDESLYVWTFHTEPLNPTRILDPINAITPNTGEAELLAWSDEGTAYVLSVPTLTEITRYEQPSGQIHASWSHAGDRILSIYSNGLNIVRDAESGEELISFRVEFLEPGIGPLDASWSNDDRRILIWGPFLFGIWDSETGRQILDLGPYAVHNAQWNSDGSRVLCWIDGGKVLLFDSKTAEVLLTLTHDDGFGGASWNGDETRILSWSSDDTVRVWDAQTGSALLELHHEYGRRGGVYGAVWAAGDTLIASWAADGTLRVWDATAGTEVQNLRDVDVLDVAVAEDSVIVALTFDWRTVELFRPATGTIEPVLAHDSDIKTFSWSSDPDFALTQTQDGGIHVWHTQSGTERLSIPSSGNSQVLWSGDYIVKWSADGIIEAWHRDIQTYIDIGRGREMQSNTALRPDSSPPLRPASGL